MKIGEFSKKVNLSKETIYYYINEGIIYPEKKGFNYNFRKEEVEIIEKVNFYKKMQFTNNEIVNILSMWKWSNKIEQSVKNQYLKILEKKNIEILDKIEKLENASKLVMNEKNKMIYNKEISENKEKTGVPIESLDLFRCPKCKGNYIIKNATMDSKNIYNGVLECKCKNFIYINDGILITENRYENKYDKPDLNRDLYLGLSSEQYKFLNSIAKNISNKVKELENKKAIILETNVNGFSFIYNNLDRFNENHLIILIDKYPEVLLSYKKIIYSIKQDLNILFIADDSLEYPIKENSIDFVISLFSANEHQLYKKESYISHIKRYLKYDGTIVGAFMSYDINSKSLEKIKEKYPEGATRETYNREKLKYNLSKNFNDYEMWDMGKTNILTNNHSFGCHVEGENMYNSFFYAKDKT